jgi:hypothetical protein
MRRTRRRIFGVLLGVGMTLGTFGGPAEADPPPSSGVVQRFIVTEGFGVFPDFENGFWVFANITRQGFCAWLAGGMVEPPPALTEDFIQEVDTGSALVVLVKPGIFPIALHPMTSPDDPCGGSEPDSWATGEAQAIINDNDVEVSGTRTNSFGDHGQGTVVDADGVAWHYSWNTRLQIKKDGEFRIVSEVRTLKKAGY